MFIWMRLQLVWGIVLYHEYFETIKDWGGNSLRKIVSGIKNLEEAWHFINAGVDGLGFVLEPKGKRYINPEHAREIILKLPPLIATIGVFINTPRYIIQELTTFCRLDWLLFKGKETPQECEDYYQPIIRYLPQIELYKDYKEINSFLIKQEKAETHGANDWETTHLIYHRIGSSKKEPTAFAFYFEIANDETIIR